MLKVKGSTGLPHMMDRNVGGSETVGSHSVKDALNQSTPVKRSAMESDQTEADLNANIDANINAPETNLEVLQTVASDVMNTEMPDKVIATSCEEETITEVDGASKAPQIVIADSEAGEELVENIVVAEEQEVHEMHNCTHNSVDGQIQAFESTGEIQDSENVIESTEEIQDSQGDISVENTTEDGASVVENQIVVQDGELVENIDEQDGTPTVVVTTAAEGGQYEIHMVSSDFGDLTEGLPEGTQLITEDGQLIHAVQEDEHGNMVVLANHPLTEIHTVDEQTGETVITETSDAIASETEDSTQHVAHDVVSEAAAQAQVSYIQEEEVLEQPPEMVMLGEDAGYIVTEGESEELIVGEAPTLEVCAETEVGTTRSETPGVYTDDNMLGKYVPDEGQVVVERIGYQPVQVPAIPHHRDQEVHHEEYFEEDDEEIGYHEDVVISESNHTIPNYDEANEIRMLTEAANNSLITMEEHYNPPKKRRPRKKKMGGEQSTEEGARPKKRRRPPHLYFNDQGEPMSGRTQSLLKGLENLNLPIATAGTAPMSPPGQKAEPQFPSSRTNVSTTFTPSLAMQHRPRTESSEIVLPSSHNRMATPHNRMPELSIPQMTSPQMVSPHLKSPNMVSPQMMSPSVISPQMISPRMISPGQQASQLSPRTISATQKKHPLLSTILSVTSPGAQGMGSNVSPPSRMVPPLNQMVRMPRNAGPVSFPFPPRRPKVADGQPQLQAATTPVTPVRQGPFINTSTVPPPTLRPPQFPVQQPGQQQLPYVSSPSTIPSQVSAQQMPRAQPPQPLPSGPNAPLQRIVRPELIKPSYSASTSVTRPPPPNLPRFQQLVSSIPSNMQPIPAQLPPVSHVAILPSESTTVNAEKTVPQHAIPSEQAAIASSQPSEMMLPNRLERNEGDGTVTKVIGGKASMEMVPAQGTTEPKPKIQDLIKSELFAAAWESRQPVPPVSITDKKIETNTLSNTISRVEERLRLAATEAQKPKAEVSIPSEKAQPPKYPATTQMASTNSPQVATAAGAKLSTHAPVQGSTLPPISTLQTKLPPGLVPSTLPPASSVAEFGIHIASAIANKQSTAFRPSPIAATVLESPPVTEGKETVLPGQIPVPRGALRSPISSSGLGKDPMLSDPNISLAASQQTTSQPSMDALRSPTHPLMVGRLPAPFPLAFAPGLPPVGLMMQPIPPLGFGRPGMMPRAGPPGEVLSPNNVPASTTGMPNTSIPPGPSQSQLRSPTADKHKVLSSTLQSPPVSQPNPLDLIMEVMKKEMSGNPPALLQSQVQKDLIRPGMVPQAPVKNEKGGLSSGPPRFPTPGPTMEMLMAIMQREVAAAQIQAQVAALHAAHAQAQAHATQSGGAQKPAVSTPTSVPQPVRPPLTGSQIAQLQAQARATMQTTPVRSALPPVSTVMPTTSSGPLPIPNQYQARSPNEVSPTVQPSSQQPKPQVPPVTSPQCQAQMTTAEVEAPSTQMHIKQPYLNNKTDDTLADKYMKEWKPTGRFQCKFCYYSCVTQNFLFRHWVMNHCCMKPYLCAYCGLKSPTRDGITRHQTSKHKGHPRRVVIDATQESTLIQNFKALFNLDVKEIHPEDIRMDSLEGLQFPEPYDPRLEKKSPGSATANGETDMFPHMAELNHMVKSEQITPEKQAHGFLPQKNYVQTADPGVMEQLPPHLREHFLAASATDTHLNESCGKTPDYLKRHHKKSMIDSAGPSGNSDGLAGPLSKEQLHALAVAQAAEIDRSMGLVQSGKTSEPQKLPSIAEMRKETRSSPVIGPSSTSNTLPSIRDLIQMPRGQILAMAGLGNSQNTQAVSGSTSFPQTIGHTFSQSQLAAAESVTKSKGTHVHSVYSAGTAPSHSASMQHDDRPVLPAGVVVPRLPHSKTPPAPLPNVSEHMQSESEAHQAAAQLVSMANSRHVVPSRHMTPQTVNRVIPDQDQQVAAMVSNVAAAAEQQKAALSIEHEVAAQLEDFARRKAGQSGKSPPAAAVATQPNIASPQNPPLSGHSTQKKLSIDEEVALQLEEFRRRKAVIEAQEALKPKKSPKAKYKRSNMSQNTGMAYQEQRHTGPNSVDEVVAQLHQLAQKRAEDQQVKSTPSTISSSSVTTSAAPVMQGDKQTVLPQSTIDEQRLLATQLEELAQRRAAAIQAAIRAQAQQNVTSPVVEREVAAQLAEFADIQRLHDESSVPAATRPVQPQKDTMYHLYERAVVESYRSTATADGEVGGGAFASKQQETASANVTSVVNNSQTECRTSSTSTYSSQTVNPEIVEAPSNSQVKTSVQSVESNKAVVAEVRTTASGTVIEKERQLEGTEYKNRQHNKKDVDSSTTHSHIQPHTNESNIEAPAVSDVDLKVHKWEGMAEYVASEVVTEVPNDTVSTEVVSNKIEKTEDRTLLSEQPEISHQSAKAASDSSQHVEDPTRNLIFGQRTVSRSADVLRSSPIQQENVCHDSEMSDVSDRTSSSPGLNATTPETLQLTPEHNAQPNEN